MRLAKLKEFRDLIYTPGSAPTMNTLRANIQTIPGGRILGGRYYIDLDEFDRETGMRDRLVDQQRQASASPLLEGLV